MEAFKCDKCGEFFEGIPEVTIESASGSYRIREVATNKVIDTGKLSLCGGCWGAVGKFIRGQD
jgi:hypothetical protein